MLGRPPPTSLAAAEPMGRAVGAAVLNVSTAMECAPVRESSPRSEPGNIKLGDHYTRRLMAFGLRGAHRQTRLPLRTGGGGGGVGGDLAGDPGGGYCRPECSCAASICPPPTSTACVSLFICSPSLAVRRRSRGHRAPGAPACRRAVPGAGARSRSAVGGGATARRRCRCPSTPVWLHFRDGNGAFSFSRA